VIDPVISPEFGMDNPIYGLPAADYQAFPSVASNGTDWLVVWEDSRRGGSDIYGARVNSGGLVLDSGGLAISTAVDQQMYPSVAANGTNWLVVWEDFRSHIYGARVNSSGTVLDSGGFAICTAAENQQFPSVAANGTDWLVVWEDYRNGYSDIYGARVNSSGVVLDSSGIAICTAANSQGSPSVAANGTNWLVVWEDFRSGTDYHIYGARVNNSGTVLDTGGIPICTAAIRQYSPSVAANGTDWLVVWADSRSGFYISDIYGARVNSSGTVLDSGGFAICTAAENQQSPSVAANGTDWLVVWVDNRRNSPPNYFADIYAARVSSSGSVLDSGGMAISTVGSGYTSVAANGTNWLVVWGEGDILGARVNSSGTVLDSSGLTSSTSANSQFSPSVAANGTDWLVVWQETRNGNSNGYDIYGARVNSIGTVLDTSGLAISTATGQQRYPSAAANGANWLVVWEDDRNSTGFSDIYGARINGSGTVLDTGGLAICTAADGQYNPSVAGNGTDWLVVWQGYLSTNNSHGIYGARVNSSGTLLDAGGFAICTAADSQYNPSVAANGTDWLVVWSDLRNDTPYINNADIYGARINSNGKVLDTNGIAICTAADYQSNPSVAANGTDWLVVWQDNRSDSSGDIYGARVNIDGMVLDTNSLAFNISGGDQTSPAAAELNGKLLVVYEGPGETGVRRIRGNILSDPLQITSALLAGSNLVFGGSGGSAGGTYYALASTNPAAWMTNWALVVTNTFGMDGSFSVTNVVDPAKPRQFFRLQVP
jgi:hypothetical protein